MKKLMLAAVAATALLGGCAHQSTAGGESQSQSQSRAETGDYVSVGSHIPRKRNQGASAAGTVGTAELEQARMGSGK